VTWCMTHLEVRGSYIEAALSSTGVSSEQLILNVADRVRNYVKSTKVLPWPPRVEELEEEEEVSPPMLQLLSALRRNNRKDLSASTISLASLLTQYIIKRPTTTAINATITLHGMTKSKVLVDSFHKLGMGISYSNVLLLRDVWAMHDLYRCSEITEGVPCISIIDNDDFRNDTLTGGGISHCTADSSCSIRDDSSSSSSSSSTLGGHRRTLVDFTSFLTRSAT